AAFWRQIVHDASQRSCCPAANISWMIFFRCKRAQTYRKISNRQNRAAAYTVALPHLSGIVYYPKLPDNSQNNYLAHLLIFRQIGIDAIRYNLKKDAKSGIFYYFLSSTTLLTLKTSKKT